MNLRKRMIDTAKGDGLTLFWRLFTIRSRVKNRRIQDILSFILYRMAHRHGGYVGRDAALRGIPVLPHGLHGVYISRFASIGEDCRIYQNVIIGEVGRQAPQIGNHCVIGAGAILVGGIRIGDNVKIGAGAVVHTDVPDNCTVVSQPCRVISKEGETT